MEDTRQQWLAQVRTGHPAGEFGHREHLLLAWLVLDATTSAADAQDEVSRIIRRIATAQGVPQRYNRTVTDAWVRIVAHCRADAGGSPAATDFDALLATYPWLLDKRALLKHYTSRTLASEQARREWVDGDVLAVPGG
jgi:hypothetical protein